MFVRSIMVCTFLVHVVARPVLYDIRVKTKNATDSKLFLLLQACPGVTKPVLEKIYTKDSEQFLALRAYKREAETRSCYPSFTGWTVGCRIDVTGGAVINHQIFNYFKNSDIEYVIEKSSKVT